ncbi:MAG TPA: hypothetical protein VFS43_03125 [Polyangiaceae bacterium]|nr:hypothetical protein [Polyangiaceae bacterium]
MVKAAPLALACLSLLSGCGSSLQNPHDTLRAYANEVEDGDAEEAYALLSTEAKRSLSLDAFRRMVRDNPAEAKELARALARPSSDPIVTATVTTPQGDEIVLVFEDGRWKLDASSVDLYGQATPRQAVRGFVRALERRRYDILLRFVPDAKKVGDASLPPLDEKRLRESWEGPQKDDMQRIAQGLKAALAAAAPIEETSDHASMPYGAQGTLQLVREHGVWKIETFN